MNKTFLRDNLKRILLVLLGSFLAALGVQLFLVPIHLLTAGIAGFALLLSYVTPIPAGLGLFILNVPIFLFCMKYLEKEFLVWSIVGMITLSASFALTAPLADLHPVKDMYLNLIAGAVVSGFGCGLVFRARASQGGTDVIAAAVRKISSVRIGYLLFVLNASVVVILAIMYGLEPALATIVVIAIESVVIERTIIGVDGNKALMIITRKPDEIAAELMKRVDRGVTIIEASGAYTHERRPIVLCILRTRQLALATKIVRDIDPESFTYVHDVTEVIGHGFKASPI
ncbi:MAG TPA: YitT family protein [Myxococcota bacterium]|nr:YitT family protein [Myxococcota bacterium]HOH76928.1 YitT family protein [Myxococcota bacterium]